MFFFLYRRHFKLEISSLTYFFEKPFICKKKNWMKNKVLYNFTLYVVCIYHIVKNFTRGSFLVKDLILNLIYSYLRCEGNFYSFEKFIKSCNDENLKVFKKRYLAYVWNSLNHYKSHREQLKFCYCFLSF